MSQEEQAQKFIEGLRVQTTGDLGADYAKAGERMHQFLQALGRSIQDPEGQRIELADNAAIAARQTASEYLASRYAQEFDISVLQNMELNDDQLASFSSQMEQKLVEPAGADAQVLDEVGKWIEENKQKIEEVANCIGKGEWKKHWWGWEIGIDYECTKKLYECLTNFGLTTPRSAFSSFKVAVAIKDALLALISKALVALPAWVGAALTGILAIFVLNCLLLAISIKAVWFFKPNSGVWIQGNWPFPLPFVMTPHVWAIPRG